MHNKRYCLSWAATAPQVISFTAAIAACEKSSQWRSAVDFLPQMTRRQVGLRMGPWGKMRQNSESMWIFSGTGCSPFFWRWFRWFHLRFLGRSYAVHRIPRLWVANPTFLLQGLLGRSPHLPDAKWNFWSSKSCPPKLDGFDNVKW